MPAPWKPSLAHYIRILYYITQRRRNQRITEEELTKIQERKLRKIIDHAYRNVPYYHELFESHGIRPEDIRTINDLQKLPFTTKQEIQRNYPDKVVAKGTRLNQCRIIPTSGSTGRPLEICLGKKTMGYYAALGYFAFFEFGLRFTDKMVSVRVPKQSVPRTWFQRLGILRVDMVSMLQPIESIIEALRAMKPDVIEGSPSVLSILAREIEDKNITGINPRMVITQSETFYDDSRNEIGDAFNAVVYDIYSTTEFSSLAFQCKEHAGYHIISDSVIMEFIKGDKNISGHELGEIVVTNLYNYDMPLIRYKLGDIGILSIKKCNCGRTFPLLSSIKGRVDDFLILPSGRIISPRGIILRYIPGIAEFRVTQEERDRFVVQVVKDKGFSEDTINQIKKQVKICCLGENINCEVEIVKDLPRERTGKLRRIVSKVSNQDDRSNNTFGA